MKLRPRSASVPHREALVEAEFLKDDPSRIAVFDAEGRAIGTLHVQAALVSHEIVEASAQEREWLALQQIDRDWPSR